MSIEQNKTIVTRIWEEIFSKGNLDLIEKLYDTNYVYHGPGGQELKGLEGLRHYKKELWTIMPDVHFTLETLIAEGDKVVAHWTMKSTYKPKNIPVTSTGMILSRIVNGKCVEDWEIFDRHWINEQGATGWVEKRMMSAITKKMKKALPFLSLST